MGGWRYFDTFSKIVDYLGQWIEFITTHLSPIWKELIIVGVLFWLLLQIIDLIFAWTSRRKVTAIVTHKERIYYPKKLKSMYLVFTDQGVYRNQDSWAFLSFDSSDVYSKLVVGETYDLIIYGYRYKWGSDYPNILKIV